MEKLVEYIVKELVEKPDEVSVSATENGNLVNVLVVVDGADMGKVIGKGGKIANAIRTVAKAMAHHENKMVNVKIESKTEVAGE